MKRPIRIIAAGGDVRQLYCAARLAADPHFEVYITGFDSEFIPPGLDLPRADLSHQKDFDCAVLPVIPLDEDGLITSPCTADKLSPEELRRAMKPDSVILAGRPDDRLQELMDGLHLIGYIDREELSLKNAVPTAEGAVQIALEELPVTLNGLSVLIVGMGRIGTALAGILRGFGAEVTAAVRNEKGAAKARIAGVRSVMTDSMDTDYGLVFNTVPYLIFGRDLLSRFHEDTLFIDLASRPGGIDFTAASELGRRVIWALGLPGKTAPVTAGEMIAETLSSILREEVYTDE